MEVNQNKKNRNSHFALYNYNTCNITNRPTQPNTKKIGDGNYKLNYGARVK